MLIVPLTVQNDFTKIEMVGVRLLTSVIVFITSKVILQGFYLEKFKVLGTSSIVFCHSFLAALYLSKVL